MNDVSAKFSKESQENAYPLKTFTPDRCDLQDVFASMSLGNLLVDPVDKIC